MPELDYHERHRPYIEAVARALADAGFPNDGGNAEPNDPRDGFIDLTVDDLPPVNGQPIWTDDQVAVCWQAERGWYLLTVADTTSNDGRFVYNLQLPTIASPHSVVMAVAEKAGLDLTLSYDGTPDHDFPDHDPYDEEDPAFEDALLAYETR